MGVTYQIHHTSSVNCFILFFLHWSVMGMRVEFTSLENLSESQIEELVIIQVINSKVNMRHSSTVINIYINIVYYF